MLYFSPHPLLHKYRYGYYFLEIGKERKYKYLVFRGSHWWRRWRYSCKSPSAAASCRTGTSLSSSTCFLLCILSCVVLYEMREGEGKREHVQDNGICPSLESLCVTTNTQAQPIFSMLHWKTCRWKLLTRFLKCQRSWPPGQYWPSIWSQAPELWCWSLWCSFAGEVHVLKEKPLALMALAGNFRVEGQIAFPTCPLPTSRDFSSSAFALLMCQVACLRRRD